MYYEEKVIDGLLHYRMTPTGKFTPMTARNLTNALLAAREEIKKQESLLDKAKEMIDDYEFAIKPTN